MIRAAVIPYGNAGIIIADGPRVLAQHAIEVGRLVDRNVERDGPGPSKRREVTPDDAAGAAAIMVAHLTAHGAQRVAVEVPEGDGAAARTAHAIGDALAFLARLAGVAVAFVGVGWRKAPDVPTLARGRDGASVLEQAAALLAFDVTASPEELAAVERAPELHVEPAPTLADLAHVEHVEHVEHGPEAPEELHVEPATSPHVGRLPPGTLTLADLARGAPVDETPTIAGCDTAPAQLAIAIVAGAAAPFRLLFGDTFKIAARAPTDEQACELAAATVHALKAARVKRLVIESVGQVFFPATMPLNAAAAVASDLLRADRMGTVLALLARQAGIEVLRPQPSTVRKAVIGKGNASDDAIAASLAGRFESWPAVSNNHVRDAIAAALYGAMPAAVEPAPVKATRAKGEPRGKAPRKARKRYEEPAAVAAREAERLAREAARQSAGCECNPRAPHRKVCPLYTPRGQG